MPPARGRERIVWQVEEVFFGGDVQGNDVDNGNKYCKKWKTRGNNQFPNSSQRLKPDIKSSKFTLLIKSFSSRLTPRAEACVSLRYRLARAHAAAVRAGRWPLSPARTPLTHTMDFYLQIFLFLGALMVMPERVAADAGNVIAGFVGTIIGLTCVCAFLGWYARRSR